MKFSEDQKEQIRQAVLKAESQTSGEIVPVIIKCSDIYPAAMYRLICFFVFTLFSICYYTGQLLENTYATLYIFFAACVLGVIANQISAIKRLFIPVKEIQEEFEQKALQSFLLNGVTQTKQRNGVQLYISAFERKAIIIADSGIQAKLENSAWEAVIQELIPHLKAKDYTAGICKSVENIGEILAAHFPHDPAETDELANKLIIDV